MPALLASLAVVAAGLLWVQPVGCLPRSRPRALPASTFSSSSSSSSSLDHSRRTRSAPRWFALMVEAAALPIAPQTAWVAAIGGVATTMVLGVALGGPGFGVLAGLASAGGGWLALRSARHRLDTVVARGVPDTLDAIARSTRAGSSVVQALAALDRPGASPSDRLLASVAGQVERGMALRQALAHLGAATSVPAVNLAVTALVVGSETGAAPARAVEGVAATLRDRLALDRELSAQSSQARASVAVLVFAPLVFGLFAMATDPRVGQFLFRTPLGWICLALGLGLNTVGALWMRRIMADVR